MVIDPFNATAGNDHDSEAVFQQIVAERRIDLYDTFRKNMDRGGVASQVEVLRGFSQDHVGRVARADMLFIDGDHSIEGCSFDYDQHESCLPPGGYLLFHDYYPERTTLGPTWVVHNKVLPSGKYRLRQVIDSLWIGQRL